MYIRNYADVDFLYKSDNKEISIKANDITKVNDEDVTFDRLVECFGIDVSLLAKENIPIEKLIELDGDIVEPENISEELTEKITEPDGDNYIEHNIVEPENISEEIMSNDEEQHYEKLFHIIDMLTILNQYTPLDKNIEIVQEPEEIKQKEVKQKQSPRGKKKTS